MRFKVGENYVEGVVETPIVDRAVDTSLNSSDKTITVPSGETWKINAWTVVLTTTATVGNRQLTTEVKNEAGVIVGRISAGAVQAASTTRYYMGLQGSFRESAFINNDIQIPIPFDSYLPGGFSVRFWDSAAIDAAADDMVVSVSTKRYKGV